jgi:hypothetical protein
LAKQGRKTTQLRPAELDREWKKAKRKK